MARSFDAATLALLDGDSLVERDLIIARIADGAYGYWSDVYNATFSEFPGVEFTGSASLISVSPISQVVADQVQTVTITLSGLATDVLATMLTLNLHQGTVEIVKALFDPSTRALVTLATVFRGLIDRDELSEDEGTSQISVTCVSRARELDRSTYRTRSFSDQIRDYSGDRFFEYAKKTGVTKISWGAGQGSGASAVASSHPAERLLQGGL